MTTSEFQRGLIYTVDPRITVALRRGEEYRVVVSSRFLVPKDQEFTGYESLYRRARRLMDGRTDELACADSDRSLNTWIVSHGWFRMEITDGALVGAVVTLGIECASAGAPRRLGSDEPTAEALTSPYVAELGPRRAGTAWFDEFYNDFDMRKDRRDASDVTISYGEYVPSPEAIDATELVARAEGRARAYLHAVGGDSEQLHIARCEWTCLDTGKSAKPFLAHVSLLFGSAL